MIDQAFQVGRGLVPHQNSSGGAIQYLTYDSEHGGHIIEGYCYEATARSL